MHLRAGNGTWGSFTRSDKNFRRPSINAVAVIAPEHLKCRCGFTEKGRIGVFPLSIAASIARCKRNLPLTVGTGGKEQGSTFQPGGYPNRTSVVSLSVIPGIGYVDCLE